MACFLWIGFKHRLLKKLLLFWVSGILGFIGQGLFPQTDLFGFLAFSANWMTVIYLLKILAVATDTQLPFRFYNYILGLSVLCGAALLALGSSYTTGSGIFCAACGVILFHGAFKHFKRSQSDIITNGYRFLLIVDAIHFFDYPFVRPVPEYAIVGFSFTLIFFFCFAVYVPIFILQKISQDYNKGLVDEVAIRTLQLRESNAQLTLAFENLKKKNDDIDSILKDSQSRLAALVHDLTNPLTIVFYNVNLLISDPEKFMSLLGTKAEKIKKAISAVDSILKEARNSYAQRLGKTDISLQQVSLDIIIKDVIDLYEDKLREKNVTVDFDHKDLKNQRVMANDAWLKNHVLSNIISNAIKFSHSGGSILIRTTQPTPGKVCLSIQDSGVGIAREKRSKIFDLNHATTSVGTQGEKGTGLGLPIVKQYIELMGGNIRIVDSTEPGTCIELTLNYAA